MHARETCLPIGELAVDLPTPEGVCEMNDRSELDVLWAHQFFDDDLDTAGFESEQEVVSQAKEHLPLCGDAGIAVVQVRAGVFLARFTLQLTSVSSAALATDHARWSESGTIVRGEAARQRALASLACSLRPSQRVRFLHQTIEQDDRALRYRMLIEGEARAVSAASAAALARELLDSLRTSLAVGADQFGFEGLERPPARVHWLEDLELVPAGITIEPMALIAIGSAANTTSRRVLLPIVPRYSQTYLCGIVAMLFSLRAPAQLVIEWRSLPANERLRGTIEREVCSLLDQSARSIRFAGCVNQGAEVPAAEVQLTHGALHDWIAEPLGASMHVRLSGMAPLTPTAARNIGREVFLGRPFAALRAPHAGGRANQWNGTVVDLRGLVTSGIPLPPLMPDPVSADAQGIARHFPHVDFDRSHSGVLLGYSSQRRLEIRFAHRDRGQHCLVLGNSGSGKTRGVIENMALQDMAEGAGLIHIDFDGDSFDYLHAACPPERRSDIVSLDLSDFDASPGLNLLQFQTRWPRIERSFIVDNLVQIFKYQYPDTPEGFGPMFELYLTNAAYLVMEEDGSTVTDISRVFADTMYRRRLLSICKDPMVTDFWRNIATKAGGDASLENIAPYIVSKLTRLVGDEMVRRVVGQAESTIDFRAGMDAGRIFLIKLSKGLLSEQAARFLGMMLVCRLFAAALSRADIAPHLRVPCNVYLDEFQNLISPTIKGMLAESRKFALRLTLSTQNLSQIPHDFAQSVLTNCATKILMRTGPQDAALLAPWVSPHFSAADLVSLPNRTAVARVVTDGVLSPAFAMRTRTLPDRDLSPETEAWVAAVRAESKARYCTDAQTIEARIAARRALPV